LADFVEILDDIFTSLIPQPRHKLLLILPVVLAHLFRKGDEVGDPGVDIFMICIFLFWRVNYRFKLCEFCLQLFRGRRLVGVVFVEPVDNQALNFLLNILSLLRIDKFEVIATLL